MWYRRSFAIDGAVPAVALLKVHKPWFGTAVFPNGQRIGEHAGCFTPGYFDLRGQLKGDGQANELVIRIGADRPALPNTVPSGCGRPDGQTSDNFIDLEHPRFEPHFFQYVRDAFAPVGLVIDFWADELTPPAQPQWTGSGSSQISVSIIPAVSTAFTPSS